jgi:cell filamentation protein
VIPGNCSRSEAKATAARLLALDAKSLTGHFALAHFPAVHRCPFQDAYDWAGEFRIVNISKGGHLFAVAAFVELALAKLLGKLPQEEFLNKLDPRKFAKAGRILPRGNQRHPSFPDGNGRAQSEFIWELAAEAGLTLIGSKVTQADDGGLGRKFCSA